MAQIKLSIVLLLAAAAITPVIAQPIGESYEVDMVERAETEDGGVESR